MPSIDVRAAAETASTYLQDLIKFQLENLRLEEVELSEDGRECLITLGFDIPTRLSNSLANIALGTNLAYQRE